MSKMIRKGFTIVPASQPIIGYAYEYDGGLVEDDLPKLVMRKYFFKNGIYTSREVICFEIDNILHNVAPGDYIDIFAELMRMTQDIVSAKEVFMNWETYKVLTWLQSVWSIATDY